MTKLVWHYTNADGLLGILQNNVIWATSCFMLNDTSEFSYGVDFLAKFWQQCSSEIIAKRRSWLAHHPEINDPTRSDEYVNDFMSRLINSLDSAELVLPIFVACASKAENNLSQWRAYADGGGFAIGLNRESPLAVRITDGSPIPNLVIKDHTGVYGTIGWTNWRDVFYDAHEQSVQSEFPILNAVGLAFNSYHPEDVRLGFAKLDLVYWALCLKNPSFADEQEVRIIIGDKNLNSHLKFRSTKYGLARYVELGGFDNHGEIKTPSSPHYITCGNQSKLPIESVCIGPQSGGNFIEKEIRSTLDHYGYSSVTIHRSNIPIR